MIKNCEVCGAEFQAQRSTAKYCSNRCRIMAKRGIEYHGELKPASACISMTDDEVSEVVQRAHVAASDLSRASMLTPSPLCMKLSRAAKKMETALRGEGL